MPLRDDQPAAFDRRDAGESVLDDKPNFLIELRRPLWACDDLRQRRAQPGNGNRSSLGWAIVYRRTHDADRSAP